MASITVTTSGYWGDDTILASLTWGQLARGDLVTVGSASTAIVLTVDPNSQTPTGITVGVSVTVLGFGEFKVYNKTTNMLIFRSFLAGLVTAEADRTITIDGDHMTLFTSNGAAGQTFDWTTIAGAKDEPPALAVFDGATRYDYVTTGPKALTDFGVGHPLGDCYAYNTTTGLITFGDGGKPSLLTANAAAGQPVVSVVSSANFVADDWVHIVSGSAPDTVLERAQILSKSGNDITLKTNLENSYTTVDGAFVRLTYGGNILPNNAVVKCPNILFGTLDNSNNPIVSVAPGDDGEFDLNPGGRISIYRAMFCGFYLNLLSNNKAQLDDVFSLRAIVFTNIDGQTLDRVVIPMDRYKTGNTQRFSGTFRYCTLTNWKVLEHVATSTCSNAGMLFTTINNCFFANPRSSSTAQEILISESSDANFIDCLFVGITRLFGQTAYIRDLKHSDTLNGVPSTTPAGLISGTNLAILFLDGLTNVLQGTSSAIAAPITSPVTLYAKNINYSVASSTFTNSSYGYIKRSYLGSPTVQIRNDGGTGFLMQNITLKNFNVPLYDLISSSLVVKMVDVSSRDTDAAPGSVKGGILHQCRHSTNRGFLGIGFNPQNFNQTIYTVSSLTELAFNGNGSVYFPVNNAWIRYEWDFPLIGMPSFPADGTVVIGGGNTNNFDISVEIDLLDGNGMSSPVVVSTGGTYDPSILAAKTIDPTKGFLFAVTFKRVVSGSTIPYLNRFNIEADVDLTYQYPLSEATLTLSGIVEGTEVRIFNSSDVELTGTESVGATGIFTYTYGYDTDVVVRVEIISVAYKNKSFNVTLREYDQAVVVQQDPDSTYLNPA